MAFDKPTRNRLAKLVADARGVIADEFTEQFQSLYGISAKGDIAPLDKLGHLDESGLATAALLRERIEYLEKTHPDDKDGTKAAVARLAREQAFTILNRLAAIRMAEKRGLIVESVGQGYQSKGFKVFETVAGSALGDTYHRYRRYLFCLFDELAIDLGVLFDRRSPQALLFPREPVLLALLDLLHAADLAPLWAEDETIGWIYQYYNDPEERKKMRKESAAPRNSRELAVRNQFFTPRYVVEFLTDNTLGRIWYEMTQGRTMLKEQCRYLVRRPTEVFLGPGESAPEVGSWQRAVGREEENLSQEDLLKQPVYIPHRAMKDPREIRLLDPACGSMHFGLYAFDLFETIYEEFWDLQVAQSSTAHCLPPTENHGEHIAQLSGPHRLAEGHGSGGSYLHDQPLVSEGGALRADQPDPQGGGFGAVEHRGGPGPADEGGIPTSSLSGSRIDPGSGNPDHHREKAGLHESGQRGGSPQPDSGSRSPRQGTHELPHSLTSSTAYSPLPTAYSSKEEFLRDVPRLIIEHNIHGIDIDPRATQIAALSLWLRAQKAWQARGVKPADRPRVRRSNIVCAEPMPGSPEMLEEFVATLDPPLLGELVKTVFDKMQLAGEAGSLLKIEEEIRTAIDTARKEWLRQQDELPLEEVGSMQRAEGSQEDATPATGKSAYRLLPTAFWETAESRLLDALRAYAEQADADSYQRRLFADDAARGFAFIDLCRKRYDAVVMNPPFGSFSKLWTAQSKAAYPNSANDILGAFVERFLNRLYDKGRLGAITSRTCFFLTTFTDWRRNVILKQSAVRVIADLGQGVMDDAMVEAAAYVLERTLPTSNMTVFRAIADGDRQRAVESCLNAHTAGIPESRLFLAFQQTFDLLPDSPFVYWIGDETIRQFDTGSSFEPDVGSVRVGLQTGDDPRYVRATWEVGFGDTIFCYYPSNGDPFCSFDDPIVQAYFKRREKGSPQWAFHVKSGASQPWYSPITLKIKWAQDGEELRNFKNDKGKLRSRPQNILFYYRPGFSWTRRAVRFYPYVIPSNCIPSVSRYMAFPDYGRQAEALAVCASRLVSAFLRFYGEKFEFPNFLVDTLKALPWPVLPDNAKMHFEQLIAREVEQRRLAYQNHEPFHEFLLPGKIRDFSNAGQSLAFDPESLLDADTEKMVADAFGFTEEQARAVERDLLEAISFQRDGGASSEDEEESSEDSEEVGGETDSDFVLDYSPAAQEEAHLSYIVGTAFGRWDIRYATGERQAPELPDPFDPLPVCPPGMLQNAEGLPAVPKDVPADYPLRISWPGILVDDENHPEDIVARVREAMAVIWDDAPVGSKQRAVGRIEEGSSGSASSLPTAHCPPPTGARAEAIEHEACQILCVLSLRDYFRRPAAFFADHLKRYSKSRRQAPIYWPLSTKSGSYTLWLYYHRLTDQTLHTCLADFLDPKLRKVQSELDALTASGGGGTRAGELREFLDELHDLRDEIERVIKLPWKPNLNDGVLITASPLHKLFRLPKWQKDLKACWGKLAKGDYDWAHLAHSIWSQRVEKACETDRSIAIAHGLEHLCKVEAVKAKRKSGKVKSEEEEVEEDDSDLI